MSKNFRIIEAASYSEPLLEEQVNDFLRELAQKGIKDDDIEIRDDFYYNEQISVFYAIVRIIWREHE